MNGSGKPVEQMGVAAASVCVCWQRIGASPARREENIPACSDRAQTCGAVIAVTGKLLWQFMHQEDISIKILGRECS